MRNFSLAVLHILPFLFLIFSCLPQYSHALTVDELEIRNKKLLEWDPPIELKEAYPYYLAGYDHHGNPVWIMEFGKWDLRWLSEGGSEFFKYATNYTDQMFLRFYDSAKIASRKHEEEFAASGKSSDENDNNVEGYICICDIDGYSNRQYLHPATVKLTLEIFQGLYNIEKTDKPPGLKTFYGVNTNFAGRSMWTLIKSQLGPFATKFDMHGTQSHRWKPILARNVPKEILPRSIGGTQDFKPLATYGKK